MIKTRQFIVAILDTVANQKRVIVAVGFLSVVLLALVFRQQGYQPATGLLIVTKYHPVAAPFLFILGYALSIVFFLPTLPLNLAAGLLWGVGWGTVIALIASTLGGVACFFLARYLGAAFPRERLGAGLWLVLEQALADHDWKVIAFTRLNPIFPFGLVSYGYGLMPIQFSRYLITTIIAVIPLTVLFAWLGQVLGDIALAGSAIELVRNLMIGSLLLTVIVVFWFTMRARIKVRNL